MIYYLGIDIAKTNHIASLIDEEGNIVLRNIKFTNSNEGYKTLFESLSNYNKDKDNILIGMEATGHYWLSLYSNLIDDNYDVSVFNPFQIKSYRPAYSLRKQKNDVIDSIIIADYLRVFGAQNSKLPKEDILALKQLTRHRTSIVQHTASLKTQVIGILDKIFPEYHTFFSDIFGNASKQLLLEAPIPEEIVKIDSTKLSNLLQKNSMGRFSKSTTIKIKETAKTSFGTKYASDACSFEIKQHINQIIFLESQIEELNIKIKELYNKLDSYLTTIPGVGEILAPIILAEIGDINNFDNPSRLVAYAGLDPTENQSGNVSSNNEKTSKRGSPHLRRAIYSAALVAMTHDENLNEYYHKKKSEGKHHYVALTGVSRKLITIIYFVLKEQRDYWP